METYQFIPTSSCFMKMYKYKFLHCHNSKCMLRVSNTLSVTFIVVTKILRRTRGKVYLTHGFKILVDCQLISFVSHHDTELDGAKRLPKRKPTHLIKLYNRDRRELKKWYSSRSCLPMTVSSHQTSLLLIPKGANILCNHQCGNLCSWVTALMIQSLLKITNF